jgi:hypothetical protein
MGELVLTVAPSQSRAFGFTTWVLNPRLGAPSSNFPQGWRKNNQIDGKLDESEWRLEEERKERGKS